MSTMNIIIASKFTLLQPQMVGISKYTCNLTVDPYHTVLFSIYYNIHLCTPILEPTTIIDTVHIAYVCTYIIYTQVRTYIHIHVHTYTHLHTHHVHTHTYTYTHVHTHTCTYSFLCLVQACVLGNLFKVCIIVK